MLKEKKVIMIPDGKAETGSNFPLSKERTPVTAVVVGTKGATLDIGILCIIFSKLKRYRLFNCYISEVRGESSSWVDEVRCFNVGSYTSE